MPRPPIRSTLSRLQTKGERAMKNIRKAAHREEESLEEGSRRAREGGEKATATPTQSIARVGLTSPMRERQRQ